MALSQRANVLAAQDEGVSIWALLQDLWDPVSNPSGYLNMGIAENSLMHDTLSAHVHANFKVPNQAFTYGDGAKRPKAAMANFFNDRFRPVKPVKPEHITLTNGCSSAIEHLSWALGNPGDVFLLGRPYYTTFPVDVGLRMGCSVLPVSFGEVDPLGLAAVQKYEEALLGAQAEGKRVAALILCHPHNPLGRCYPRDVILDLMRLCQKYQVHLISDEIYALSVFHNTIDSEPPPIPFESALSIDTTDVIDPALVHLVWGMSKDFGANGLRIGAIVSQANPGLLRAMIPVSLYSSTSLISEEITTKILEDKAWVDAYVAENQSKLASNYELVAKWAKTMGVPYAAGVNAAFFLWADLGTAYLRNVAHDGSGDVDVDKVVFEALLKAKVWVGAGMVFGAEKKGWFRIVFSQKKEYVEEGLKRIEAALKPE